MVNAIFMGIDHADRRADGHEDVQTGCTLYGVNLLHTPMLFSLGFLTQFLLGGLTGVMLAVVPFDWQVSDSYFVMIFHYVLFGGLVFSIFAAIYYWLPKVSGRMLEREESRQMALLAVHRIQSDARADARHAAPTGMPRRIYTYQADRGWELWNLLSSIGVLFQIAAILFFAYNVINSLFRGKKAGDDPWDAWTLEWATTSPPPTTSTRTSPPFCSRRPLLGQEASRRSRLEVRVLPP